MLPQVKEAWERGQTLFQEAFNRAISDQEDMESFSMIDFARNCYAEVAASRVYPISLHSGTGGQWVYAGMARILPQESGGS